MEFYCIIQIDMVLYSHSKEQDRSKAGKEKTMKTFYFDNFNDFEESGVAGEYEVTAIVKKDHCNSLCADLMTECKSWKTAIRRFFKSLTDYPGFNGWQDGILESCENGYFSDKETYFEGGKSVYCKGGYFWEVENYDDCWYICLNVPV